MQDMTSRNGANGGDTGSAATLAGNGKPQGLDRYISPDSEPSWSGIDIGEIRAMAWRQRRMLAVLAAAAVIAGLIITLLMTPIYGSAASVRVDNEGLRITEGDDVNPVISTFEIDRYLNTQKEVVESRSMALAVADQLGLARDDAFLTAMDVEGVPGTLAPEQRAAARRNLVASVLQENVNMEIQPQNRIVLIGFTSPDPSQAARIANAYAETFVAQNVQGRFDANAYAKRILQDQVAELQAELSETETAAVEYARRNRLIDTGTSPGDDEEGGSASPSVTTGNLVQINRNYIDARADRILAEQRWNAARNTSALDLPEARNNAAIQSLLTRRATAQANLEQLRERYLDGYPEIERAEAEVASINQALDSAASSLRNSIRNEYQVALAQEERLAAARTSLADETLDEQNRRVQLNILSRDADNKRERLAELQRRLSQIESAADVDANNITLLDTAGVPSTPFSPSYPRNLLISLVLGLIVGGGLAVVREAVDDTLYSPEDAERKLGLPLLGTTPLVDETDRDSMEDTHSELNEAYYSIRAAIDYATAGDRHKVIQVTSGQPSEGKSTTALALARDFARIGRRVLLIDSDLRNPSLHRLLGEKNKSGMMDVLMNRIPVSDAIKPVGTDGLHAMTLGPIPPNPVQILSGNLVGDLLDKLRADYDVVIIDSAPVMGLADAPMLSRLADFTVLIVEAGRAHYGQARTAVRRLNETGANIVGIVMTKFDFRDAGYSYDYHYSYYAYGSNDRDAA